MSDSDPEHHDVPLFQRQPPDLRPINLSPEQPTVPPDAWFPYDFNDSPAPPRPSAPQASAPPSYSTDPPPPGVSPEEPAEPRPRHHVPRNPTEPPPRADRSPPTRSPRARSPIRTPPLSPRPRRHSSSRVRQSASSHRSNSTPSTVPDPVDLVRALETIIREQNVVSNFNEISALCEDLLDIVFESAHKMFTNLPIFPNNYRRPEVDRLLERHDVGGLLLQQFEVVSRLSGVHPDADTRATFMANFLQLTRGFQSVKTILATLYGKMHEVMDPTSLLDPAVEAFRIIMHDKLCFLQSLSHVIAGLIGRQTDIQQLEDFESEWRSQTIQIDTLSIPGKVRLAASRLKSHHARPGDNQLVERFTEQQFSLTSNIEERLENTIENLQKFHSEVVHPGRNGLKLSSRAVNNTQKLTKIIPGLFLIVQHPGFNPPHVNNNSSLAQEVLRQNFDLNFVNSPVTVNNLKLEIDRLVLFTQTLLELPGVRVSSGTSSSTTQHVPCKTEKTSGKSTPSVHNNTNSIDLLLAECREYAVQLERQINDCQVFYDADPDDVNQYVKLSDDLSAIQKFALTSLESLKTASRSEELSDYSRTICRSEISTLEKLFFQSNNLTTMFNRLDRKFKLSLDNQNKMFLKNHQQLRIAPWPGSNSKGSKKLTTAEISQNFLTFMSEILQACSSPFLTNRQRLRKLSDSISSPVIRAATGSHVTFPSAISYLLKEFKPEKASIIVTTRQLNRIGSKNGAPSPAEEYTNLLALRKIKMDALKSHYLLKVLEKCVGKTSAELQSIGNRLRSPDYIDTLILDFSSYQNLEEFLPGAPGEEPQQERRAQVEILLSYQIQKDSLERFVRRGLSPQTQLQFYKDASHLNVDITSELAFQGFFWYFCDTHMLLSSNTASGLKHQLEINANSGASGSSRNTYQHYGINPEELSSDNSENSEVEDSLALWTQTGARPKSKNKKSNKKSTKKGSKAKKSISHNNLAASSTSHFTCPLDPANIHKGHRPYQCPLLKKPSQKLIQSFLNKGVCIACLNKKLDAHSNSCQPMTQNTETRELVPVYCDKCSRLNIPKLKISCLQNRRICNCAQRKYQQNVSKSGSNVNLTSSPKPSRSSSKTKTKKNAFKSKDKGTKSNSISLNTTLETEASEESESEATPDENVIFYVAPDEGSSGQSSPEPEEITEQIKFNSLWYYNQEQPGVESDPGEEPTDLVDDLDAFHLYWFGVDGIEYDDTEPEDNLEPVGMSHSEPVLINKVEAVEIPLMPRPNTPTVADFSLAKLCKELPYVNNPDCQTFLLSESLDFVSKSGLNVRRRCIWDSGAQKTCINLNHIPQDCYFGKKAKFNIQTVNGNKDCPDSCRATFFITNSPKENEHPVTYKFFGLGLRFNQKVCTPDLELDEHDAQLLQAMQARISSYRAHNLMCIIGSDCLSVWPSEVLRTDNYCIFRSKINPKRLLAAGNFETNFKEKTKSQLEKIKVQLLLYDEHQTFPHLQSRQLETSIELEDSQIQQLFQPPAAVEDHPFLASILKPLQDTDNNAPQSADLQPRHSSPFSAVPDLEYSCSSDNSQSEVSSVSDRSEYKANHPWYCNSPPLSEHSGLTLDRELDASPPSCSTDYSNCVNDFDRQNKYAAFFMSRLEQRLEQFQRCQSFVLPSKMSNPTRQLDLDRSIDVVVENNDYDSEEDVVTNIIGPEPELDQEKQI